MILIMVQYLNELQQLAITYLSQEFKHTTIVEKENDAVGLEGITDLPLSRGVVLAGQQVAPRTALEVEKAYNYESTGNLFIYPGKRITHTLDVAITRALSKLNMEHGYKVERHDEEDGRIKYYISPQKGKIEDSDLGEFSDLSLADALQSASPGEDPINTIIDRAAYLRKSLKDLPDFIVDDRPGEN